MNTAVVWQDYLPWSTIFRSTKPVLYYTLQSLKCHGRFAQTTELKATIVAWGLAHSHPIPTWRNNIMSIVIHNVPNKFCTGISEKGKKAKCWEQQLSKSSVCAVILQTCCFTGIIQVNDTPAIQYKIQKCVKFCKFQIIVNPDGTCYFSHWSFLCPMCLFAIDKVPQRISSGFHYAASE